MKPAKNHIHKLSRVPGKAPTCTTKGQKEYYTCDCGKWFEDAEGKTEITLSTSIVSPAAHEYGSLIPEKPATHTPEGEIQPGMKEHYVCAECGTHFDANKQKKTEDKLAVEKVEHRFYDEDHNGQCDDCEKILKALAAEQEQPNQPTENGNQTEEKDADTGSGTPWWIVLLLALLATGGGILVALLLLKKKEKTE
jgi:DNA-directed RNA polymerase subunit RPC12/RpoP